MSWRGSKPPKKVLVQLWRGIYFFFGVDGRGTKEQIFNTRHVPTARKEVRLYESRGIPVERFKEFEFE